MLLEQRPPDGLGGVRGEDDVDGLGPERVEHLPGRLAEADHQALERLVDVGLGGRGGLVGEPAAAPVRLRPVAVRHLDLLGDVGQAEHVREGARHHDGVAHVQARQERAQLVQPRRVAGDVVLAGEPQALLDHLSGVAAVEALEDVQEPRDEERLVARQAVVRGHLLRRELPPGVGVGGPPLLGTAAGADHSRHRLGGRRRLALSPADGAPRELEPPPARRELHEAGEGCETEGIHGAASRRTQNTCTRSLSGEKRSYEYQHHGKRAIQMFDGRFVAQLLERVKIVRNPAAASFQFWMHLVPPSPQKLSPSSLLLPLQA